MVTTPKKKIPRKAAAKNTSVKKVAGSGEPAKQTSSGNKAVKNKVANTEKQSVTNTAEDSMVVLAPVLLINDAKKLYSSLSQALSSTRGVSIDASSVEMVDTAMLQMLLAFIEKMRVQQKKYKWLDPSKELLKRAETLNMSERLGFNDMDG